MVNGADTVSESIAIEASADDTTTEVTTGTSSTVAFLDTFLVTLTVFFAGLHLLPGIADPIFSFVLDKDCQPWLCRVQHHILHQQQL